MFTEAGISREKALALLHTYVEKENMLLHCYASEMVMKKLACYLQQNEDCWGMAGLLHDIDVEITNADPYTHGKKAIEILTQAGLNADIIEAIALHNEVSAHRERHSVLEHALASGETITGLITATTLVYPDKKIASVKAKSIIKRMKEKNFAASVKRENILECELIGISLESFTEIALEAMKSISEKLKL